MHWDKDPDSYKKWPGYGQSKTANIYTASSITRHYGKQNLIGLSVHPGAIKTNLSRHLSEEDFKIMGDPAKAAPMYKSPEQGAATTVWAAVSPHFEGKNGGMYLGDVGEASKATPNDRPAVAAYYPHTYDEDAEERLWKLSCKTLDVPEN